MWEQLDAVDWAALEHNHGSAEDVPGLLRRCAGPDPDDAAAAADRLSSTLYHQGGWICSAASAALPFLLRLAEMRQVSSRRDALRLVAMLADLAECVQAEWLDPGWPPAWERALPDVLALLADPEPAIRREVAHVIGASPGELTLPALLRCWQAEDDPVTRLDLVLALGHGLQRPPVGPLRTAVLDLLRGLLDAAEAQIRLAAVHALAPRDPDLPARGLDRLLAAVRHPSVELWRHTAARESDVLGVHRWTGQLFDGPSPSYVLGLLNDHTDDEQRVGALAEAGTLLARWRSPGAALLPRLVERLHDPSAEVRFRAAELLACLGHEAAAHADDVAALLDDTAARRGDSQETVSEAALWALARMNDPRCLPGLVERIGGARSGFSPYNSLGYPTRDWPHIPGLPALWEVLAFLPNHAEALLPAICDLVATAEDDDLLRGYGKLLENWGPAAAPAVPRLLSLLEDERTWPMAARALGGIGLPGIQAKDLLLRRSGAGGHHAQLAAWAYGRVGGDPGVALDALGRAADDQGFPNFSKIADLGPRAAPYAERLRTALPTYEQPRTRVEAAHALWAVTGDTQATVPVLTEVVRDLAEGHHNPVMLKAVRYLVRMGPAAWPAADLLGAVPAVDRRLRHSGAWRGFVEDEQIRAAVDELLTLTHQPG